MENRDLDKVDLTEFRELLSSTTKEKAPDPNKAPEPKKPPEPTPDELARQNFMLKVYYLEKKISAKCASTKFPASAENIVWRIRNVLYRAIHRAAPR